MANTKFIKVKENFVCENCGAEVLGSGYTNHCPKCLWSRHMDINPGDRAEKCGGMMEPIGVELVSGKYDIIQKCQRCGAEKRNKVSEDDNLDIILALAERSFRE